MCKVKDMQNKTVVITVAHSSMVIDATVNAKKENIAESFFIGDKLLSSNTRKKLLDH